MAIKLDTFHTLDLETLAVWIWEAGWNYVSGTIYTKDNMAGNLVMHDNYYSIETKGS